MTLIAKIDGLLAGITTADIENLPPVHRHRLAQALRRIADPPPKAGVQCRRAATWDGRFD